MQRRRKHHAPFKRRGLSEKPAKPADDTLRLSGARAVMALFQRDPDAIRRLWLDREAARGAGAMCRYLAQRRRSYAVKDDVELAKIAGTLHHGGMVAAVAPRPPRPPGAAEIAAWADRRASVLAMDGVSNPHNFGAIVRTAAFLGVGHVVLSERAEQALPSPASYRVAEGGFEFVELWRPPSLARFLGELGRRHRVIAAAPRGRPLASIVRDARPIALVLGNEETGLSPQVERACSALVAIPGGRVESLNVSVAAGILIHALLVQPQ
ncbi:MAG: TrmH family RNA methyltransferase [Rhodospirillales bacterium]